MFKKINAMALVLVMTFALGLTAHAESGVGVTAEQAEASITTDGRGGMTGPGGVTDGYNTNAYRTTATGRGTNWGWIGLLGLIGLAGLRGRNNNQNPNPQR